MTGVLNVVADISTVVEDRRQESHDVMLEELGTEEDPFGTNPLPIDSPILLVKINRRSND